MPKYVRRKNASCGIASRDWRAFDLVINKLVREDGSISPKDLINAKDEHSFLKKYFDKTPEEATEQLNIAAAKKMIGAINNDGRRSFAYSRTVKRYLPFFDVYDSNETFETELTIKNLRFALAFAPKNMKPKIEVLLSELTEE